jgi:hypothetical protein
MMGWYWLIDKADVVIMRIPFLDIDPSSALKAHMYICIQNGNDKEFIKCQTFKPTHILTCCPPKYYLIEEQNISRNPFIRKITIDCDKSFCVSCVTIDKKSLEKRNVCNELFDSIIEKIKHSDFCKGYLDPISLSMLNHFIYPNI